MKIGFMLESNDTSVESISYISYHNDLQFNCYDLEPYLLNILHTNTSQFLYYHVHQRRLLSFVIL